MQKVLVLAFILFNTAFSFDITAVGRNFRDFTVRDEKGQEMKASQIIDSRPGIIVFFALGDKPGTFDFLPHMNRLYEKYGDDVVFMAVLLSRSNLKELKELKRMLPLKMPVYLAYSDSIKNYSIRKVDVPLILIVDGRGTVRYMIARPESPMIEIYPEETVPFADEKQENRIKGSIGLIDGYIKKVLEN